MQCLNCGEDIPGYDNFCEECYYELTAEEMQELEDEQDEINDGYGE
jgi:predicted amidophosphoribosyltransferase